MTQRFAPEPPSLRAELWRSALGVCLAGPVLLWCKDVPLLWGVVILPLVLLGMLGGDFWKCRVRGRDLVELEAEGVRVTNRRRT